MNALLNWLRQPYPSTDARGYIWRNALVGGLFVTFFLFLFRPFGIDLGNLGVWAAFGICAEYGLVTGAVAVLWGGLVALLPAVFQEEKWRVWKEILSNLLFVAAIGLANQLYSAWRFDMSLTLRAALAWQKITFLVGVFPIAIGVFAKQMRLLRRFSREAASLTTHMTHQHAPAPLAPLTLNGDNQNETLVLAPDQLLYLSAADNYVQVFFLENGQLRQRLLRSALKKMEDVLAPYPQFFRCHRTYVVNLDKVHRVSGNAQGYRLHLEGAGTEIPVSRALNEAIRERLGK